MVANELKVHLFAMMMNGWCHSTARKRQRKRLNLIIASLVLTACNVVSASIIPSVGTHQKPVFGPPHESQTRLHDQLGAVASENGICSQIGIDLLKEGGNAADALVGTVFCVGVIGMYHSGIGGGGFMLVRGSDGKYEDIDFRETAPAAYYQDMYNEDPMTSVFGGLASGVPSEVRGLQYLHETYGILPWKHVMQGAIRVARYGWPVNEDLVKFMDFSKTYAGAFLVENPAWAVDFAPNGTLLGLGDTITRKRYAETLEIIANEGPDAFYTGRIAGTMINALAAANGTMTLDDLQNYKVIIRKPSNITYRGFRLHSCSNPSAGEVALAVLKTVEGYDDFFHPGTVNLSTHRLDEATRFGYGARASLGDPGYVKGMEAFQEDLVSEDRAKHIRSKIHDKHTLNISAYDPSGFEILENHGTSQVVAADKSGMAITLTTTVNLIFGSALIIPETGVIMNNEQNDFSIPGHRNEFGYAPSPANYVRPGKRPLSSITPVIAEWPNGTLYYIIGAAGGSRIITSVIQNLVHVLDRNMTTREALEQPRMHDQLIPNQALFEYAYDNATVAFMKERGHNVTWVPNELSSAQGIRRHPNGTFEAAGEPRQKNSAGYAV